MHWLSPAIHSMCAVPASLPMCSACLLSFDLPNATNCSRDRLGGSGGSAGRLGGPPLDDDDAFSYRFTTLDEVQGQVLSIAKDQNGCRCVSALQRAPCCASIAGTSSG